MGCNSVSSQLILVQTDIISVSPSFRQNVDGITKFEKKKNQEVPEKICKSLNFFQQYGGEEEESNVLRP